MCLGIVSACGGDPLVSLHHRNTANYRLPTFGPHGTNLGHSWLRCIINMDFLAGLTILKKEMCLGILNACGGDPAVALHLRNAADYRLPNFGPHGTKLGHSWLLWTKKKWFSGWFDNSEKGDVSGQLEHLGGWSCACTSPQEHYQLPLTFFWVTWHQTRAFLILMKNKNLFNGLLDNSEKGDVSGHCERFRG